MKSFRFLPLLAALMMFGVAAGVTPRAQASVAMQQAQPTGGEQTAPDAQSAEKKEQINDENKEYRESDTVKALGKMLGMSTDTAATAFTWFNFAVLAILAGVFLSKALPKTFRKRTTDIQKKLVDARTATEEANARLNAVEARLSKLDSQIGEMRTQADKDSTRDAQRIRESIEDEKAKILEAAEAEIQAATVTARRAIGHYAAELAVEQAARKLIVTAETDRLLVRTFAERLGAKNGSEN